jgi:hypothetical protein
MPRYRIDTVDYSSGNSLDNNPMTNMNDAHPTIDFNSTGGFDILFADISDGVLDLDPASPCLYDGVAINASNGLYAIAPNLVEKDINDRDRSLNNDAGAYQRESRPGPTTGITVEDAFFADDGTQLPGRVSPISLAQAVWRNDSNSPIINSDVVTAISQSRTFTDCRLTSFRIRMKFQTSLLNGTRAGIVLRYQNSQNYMYAYYQSGNDAVRLYEHVAGVDTEVPGSGTLSPAGIVDTWYDFWLEDDDVAQEIRAYVKISPDEDGTTPISTWAYAALNVAMVPTTLVGLYWGASASQYSLDQFRVQSL